MNDKQYQNCKTKRSIVNSFVCNTSLCPSFNKNLNEKKKKNDKQYALHNTVWNSTFQQSIANTLTNNETFWQALIQKCQIALTKLELPYFLEIAFVHSGLVLSQVQKTLLCKIRCTHTHKHLSCSVQCCKKILTIDS